MKRKWVLGVVIFQIGLLAAVVSMIADYVGLGGPYIMFGPKQILGTAVGVVVALWGIIFALRAK
ncbi:MAG: hypothetical protein ISR58_11260 [Anaerolineales bacterium]|nr:hypothetical protein [Chloroflexota bacterium]MBL6981753.1 hypothetical protein [Anaerolineales bacterium]